MRRAPFLVPGCLSRLLVLLEGVELLYDTRRLIKAPHFATAHVACI